MSGQDKVLISDMMEGFVSEAPPTPFVSYCVVCHVFLTEEEMVYEKGKVFHRTCFEEHGKEYPEINHDLLTQNTNAKVQLIQLKNLKIRQHGDIDQSNSKPKSTTKTKRNLKKKSLKKKPVKKRKSTSKRKKSSKRTRKNRSLTKRRVSSKKGKKSRKTAKKTRKTIKKRPTRRKSPKRKTRRRR